MKVRVYQLGQECGVSSAAVLGYLHSIGEFVRSASSTVESPVAKYVRRYFAEMTEAERDKLSDRPRARPALSLREEAFQRAAEQREEIEQLAQELLGIDPRRLRFRKDRPRRDGRSA